MVRVDGSVDLEARASFVNSSVMAKIFKVRTSEVWSKRKSIAHTGRGELLGGEHRERSRRPAGSVSSAGEAREVPPHGRGAGCACG